MSMNFGSSLLPNPVSISTRPSGCSIRRQRIARGIRFRGSGAMRFSQSGLGTTPNMAPPTRRWMPASRAWQRKAPIWKRCERGMAEDNFSFLLSPSYFQYADHLDILVPRLLVRCTRPDPTRRRLYSARPHRMESPAGPLQPGRPGPAPRDHRALHVRGDRAGAAQPICGVRPRAGVGARPGARLLRPFGQRIAGAVRHPEGRRAHPEVPYAGGDADHDVEMASRHGGARSASPRTELPHA